MPPPLLAPAAPPPDVAALPADPLSALHDALLAAERAAGLDARLRELLVGAQRFGAGAGTVVVHGEAFTPQRVVTLPAAGRDDAPDAAGAVRGPVWRRWLRVLAKRQASYGVGSAYALPLDDPWIRAEFGEPLCGSGRPFPAGLLLAPLAAGTGQALATLVVEVPGAWPPLPALVSAVEVLARHAGLQIEQDRFAALAERRAERLQRLHEAGAALTRTLDEREILRELARQAGRLLPADAVVIAHPDLELGVVRTAYRQVRGVVRPRADQPLGAGVVATVARTGEGLRVDDYDPHREALAAADDVVGDGGPAGSVLAAPMRVGTQLVGVVAVHAEAIRAFSAEDEELLRTVAAQAGTAVANARLFAESEAERRQSEALAEVARAVTGSLRLGEVLRLILRHTTALLRAEGACIALRRDEFLHVVAGVGCVELLAGVHIPAAASMMGRALRERRPLISNDVRGDRAFYRPLQQIAPIDKAVLVPLYAGDEPVAVVAVVNRAADFTEADARVLQRLADHVGVAVANARLFEDVEAATREWKAAFDAVAAGMVVLDEQGRVERANARAAELLGAGGAKALLGQAFAAALAGAPAETADAACEIADVVGAAMTRGETARRAVRAPARGRLFDVLAAPHPGGGAVVTFDDVTEHHALARRYRLVVDTVRDAVVTMDAGGRVTFANPAALALFGRGDALLGAPPTTLVRPEDVAEVERRARAVRAGVPQRYEVVVCRPDGERRLVSVSTAPVGPEDGAGEATEVVASLRDVTDERRLVGQLVQREKLAAVGRLVGGVAHELNNPLTALLTLAELLAAEGDGAPDAGETRELARTLHAEARRAARIACRLLAFAGQRAPSRDVADVNRLLLDAVELRRYALRVQGIDIVLDLDYELPATWGDPHQLQQVFLNLVTNAEQALSLADGARRLEARTRREGERLVVAVGDTGPGMSAEEVARVLDPLYSAAPGGAGAGLGLSISEGIVREHGGTLTVDTRPGAGATFVVTLPIVEPPVQAGGGAEGVDGGTARG